MQYWRLIFKGLKEYAAKTREKVYSGLLRDSTFIKKPTSLLTLPLNQRCDKDIKKQLQKPPGNTNFIID